jgi:hypothetical protein
MAFLPTILACVRIVGVAAHVPTGPRIALSAGTTASSATGLAAAAGAGSAAAGLRLVLLQPFVLGEQQFSVGGLVHLDHVVCAGLQSPGDLLDGQSVNVKECLHGDHKLLIPGLLHSKVLAHHLVLRLRVT